MYEAVLSSSRDSLLVAIPFIGLLVAGFFRLDQIAASPKHGQKPQRPPSGVDEDGEAIFCDPDGRVVKERRPRK